MISVVTVPNTGTIYTLGLLRGWGVEIERKHLENTDAPPYGKDRFGPGFPCPSSDEWEDYPHGRRVVCTLRDPILAVISAINRRVPDRDISVDGWAVMANWHERRVPSVHFFPIPPNHTGFVELRRFVGLDDPWSGWGVPTNASSDRTGLKVSYLEGDVPRHPTVQRAVGQLAGMPAVEELFVDHGLATPWREAAR